MRKIVASFSSLLLALTVGCIVPTPKPPTPPVLLRLDVGVYDTHGAIVGATVAIIDGINEGVHGTTSAQGNIILTGLKPGGFSVCAMAPTYVKACAGVELKTDTATQLHLTATPPPEPPVSAAPVLRPDGRIFRDAAGRPWRYKGVSAFALLDRFAKAAGITDTLNAYAGFNTLRVWMYTPAKDWGVRAWDVQSVGMTKDFLAYVGAKGWTVELTLLTDDDPAQLAWAHTFVQQLAAAPRPTNVLIEIGNEPDTHKHIDTRALKPTLDASGFVYASGNYEDSTKAFGKYLVTHTQRDAEWMRRSHDCLEFYNGGGPNKPTDPAHPMPCVLDEGPKDQDVPGSTPDDWRAYGGGGSLMAAGATFHSETGKFGLPPTPREATLAAALLEALNAFPADAPLLLYGRPVEQSLRTYTAGGRYMTRVRPTSATPGPGWNRIGSSNVLWSH